MRNALKSRAQASQIGELYYTDLYTPLYFISRISFFLYNYVSITHHNLWLSWRQLWRQWCTDIIQSSFISIPPQYVHHYIHVWIAFEFSYAGVAKVAIFYSFYVHSPKVQKVLRITRKLDPLRIASYFFLFFSSFEGPTCTNSISKATLK